MSASITAAAVGIARDARTALRVRSRFFLGMSFVLLAIVFLGFAPTLIGASMSRRGCTSCPRWSG
jgi:hypothetical protein